MNRSDRAWALWADWCTATGHDLADVSPSALRRFAAQVPGTAGARVPGGAAARRLITRPRRDPWEVAERDWAPVDTSLARCPAYGWPSAVPGRRDAWLIVAARVLRLPRPLAVGLRVHDLPTHLKALPRPGRSAPCHRCVALRWLDVVHTYEQWSRSAVRNQVWSRPPGTWSPSVLGSAVPCDHGCDRLDTLLATIPRHTVVSPAIDQHGWWTHWRPLSTRALTAVLARRCDAYAPAPEPDADPLDLFTPAVGEFDDTTFARLDAAIDAAAAVNSRLEALLAEYET